MRQNIFLGGGPFGSQQVAVLGPTLGQVRSGYQWNRTDRTVESSRYNWTPRPGPTQFRAAPTARPSVVPAAAGGGDIGCYFCANLGGAPTYWMSGNQAQQWNNDRNAGCERVDDKECQRKYSQMQTRQQASIRRTGFNPFSLPSTQVTTSAMAPTATSTYAPMMSGRIRVQNPELIG